MSVATNRQVPDHSIFDAYNKQVYLGNGYSLPATLSLSGTSETLLYLIKNPAITTSAFPASYQSLFINLRRYASSAQQVIIKTYYGPTISTTSTAATPVNLRSGSLNTSVSLCYLNGQFTVSANGTLISNLGCDGVDHPSEDSQLLVLDPGKNLLITATAVSATTSLIAGVSWYEL